MKRSLLGAALAAAVLALGVVPAAADYPDRQITLVVPFSSGGTTDILGRLVADQLEERLGATVGVDNRSGAGGTIAARQCQRLARCTNLIPDPRGSPRRPRSA